MVIYVDSCGMRVHYRQNDNDATQLTLNLLQYSFEFIKHSIDVHKLFYFDLHYMYIQSATKVFVHLIIER